MTRKLSIAMVDPAAYSLPYDSALCEALSARGHDVTLYTTRFAHGAMPKARGYTLSEWFYRRSVPGLRRRWSRAVQHPLDLLRLRRRLARTAPDIVHVQWSVVDSLDVPFWRALPQPTVFTAHNALPREDQGESLNCKALRAFDAVVAHSEYGEQGLRERCRLPRLWRIPHGALDRYQDAAVGHPPPVQLGDGPVVALAGLLRPYKGVQVLLDAWPAVRAAVPAAELVIAGRPMGIELPQDPPPGVHLLPRFLEDPDFAWILERADLVCLPYTAIDLSGVLFSAIALGRPMVLSDVGGFTELEGQGARLVPPGDSGALAETLIALLQDPQAREQLAREATLAAREVYDWDSIAKRYEQHYMELLV